jgi:outer membrane protein insertion porin family
MNVFLRKNIVRFAVIAISLAAQPIYAQAQEGQLIVEQVKILGLRKTNEQIVQRYLSFRAGDVLTPELIEQNQQTLQATNFFKQVGFRSEPGSARGQVIVVCEVIERQWPTFEFAGGYSELDGWYFSPLGVRYDNLFGTGHRLGLRLILGYRVAGANLRFFQPNIFNRAINFQFDADVTGRQIIHYFDTRASRQNIANAGLRLALNGSRGLGKYLSGGVQFNEAQPDSFATQANTDSALFTFPEIIAKDLGRKRFRSAWLRLQADTRDNALFPTKGIWGALLVEAVGGDTDFNRTVFDGRVYQKLGSGVLAWRLKLAKTSEATPFYERFYLGGVNSLRSFDERRLTPVGYGTKLSLSNLEYRIPLEWDKQGKPRFIGVLFFDAGRINGLKEIIGDDVVKSLGFGVRVKVPVLGLLRMDFAYPEKHPDDFHFYLTLGNLF